MSASCDVATAATLFLTQENHPCLIWAKAAVEAYADLQPMMKELRAGDVLPQLRPTRGYYV